jgi:putative heme-binding domain-containing protein
MRRSIVTGIGASRLWRRWRFFAPVTLVACLAVNALGQTDNASPANPKPASKAKIKNIFDEDQSDSKPESDSKPDSNDKPESDAEAEANAKAAAQADAVIAALGKSLDQPAEASRRIAELTEPLANRAIAALREHDRAGRYADNAEGRTLRRDVLIALAKSGDFRSVHYLHETFEAFPERREDVSVALTHYAARHGRKPDEWQMLVRALPVLDATAAKEVLKSLGTFPRRGSKPKWQREVILAGLRLAPNDRDVAVKLLEHWTGRKKPAEEDSPTARLAAWQSWFESTYPDEPLARLPVDPMDAKRPFAALVALVKKDLPKADVQRGAAVFDKAACIKCHRMGPKGEAMGPDLTSTPHRLQDRELLEAIVFPSQSIADDYSSNSVATKDGRIYSGVVNQAAGKVTVLQANGEKVALMRQEIERIAPQRLSSMPDKLLDALSDQEIVDLCAFLLHREKR